MTTRAVYPCTQRAIIHLDLDAFYAQVEIVRNGLGPETSLVVLQWNGILAVSYPARKFGIKRFCTIQEAMKMCPALVVQHVPTFKAGETEPGYHPNPDIRTHKASLQVYREASAKIMKIIYQAFPLFQKASVDEAFIDVTDRVWEMIESDGYSFDLDPVVKWSELKGQDTYMIGEEEMKDSSGWANLMLFYAAKISYDLRMKIFNDLHYTCSTGIAHNKTLAKLVSAANKPAKQTVLIDENTMEYMKTIPITKIRGLGGKKGDLITATFECEMASDLWKYSVQDLKSKLGAAEGQWTFDIVRGDCSEEVLQAQLTKSMQSCKNFSKGLTNMATVLHWFTNMSSELFYRVQADFEETKRWPRTIGVSVRIGKDKTSKQAPFPHRDDVQCGEDLGKLALALYNEIGARFPLHFIGIHLTGLEKAGRESIRDFFKSGPKQESSTSNIIDDPKSMKSEPLPITAKAEEKPIEKIEDSFGSRLKVILDTIDEDGNPIYYKCYCGEVMKRNVRLEHEDHHFAMELSRSRDPITAIKTPKRELPKTPKASKKAKKQSNSGDIQSFFRK